MRQPTIATTTKTISSYPSALAIALAAMIAIAIGLGTYLLASRTSTRTVARPSATTSLIQPVSPAFAGVLQRSRIRVLDPTKPPF
jgi:hypothetical protein